MHIIYEYITGSHLYGTSTDKSDTDIRGVFIADINNYFGLEKVETFRYKDEDKEYYELKKYIRLLMDNNPNILEGLFVDGVHILKTSYEWNKIRENYLMFLDKKKIYRKFLAYAHSQKKKMIIRSDNYNNLETALDFLNNLPEDFYSISMIDILTTGRSNSVFTVDGERIKVGDMFVSKYDTVNTATKKIRQRLEKFSNRKDLISKYGYDTKFAMHLIRLLLEGIELLEYREIKFPLRKREYLLGIRNGELPVDEILQLSEKLEAEFKRIYEKTDGFKTNYNYVNNLLINILQREFCIMA